jgi:hypothetical protein
MKKLAIFLFIFVPTLVYSQVKGTVINLKTKEKIPYVNIWVENENIGATASLQGEFELAVTKPKVIIFSAIGFETKKINSDSIKNIVELKPAITELAEVIVTQKRQTQRFTIGEFKKSQISSGFACGKTPWIVARYFAYKQDYQDTKFLEKIKVFTNSDVKDAKFNVRLYGVNSEGKPEGYIYDENIIGIAKKGRKMTEIDLSELNIEFPEKGFFVALEWLIVEENKYEYKYTMQGSNRKLVGFRYEPSFGCIPVETDDNSWIFMQGQWNKIWKNSHLMLDKYKEKYALIAVELTLTN